MGLMARMAEKEGLKSLWRGLDAAMLLNLPLIAIYLPCYDYIEGTLGRSYLGMYGPLVSGGFTAHFSRMSRCHTALVGMCPSQFVPRAAGMMSRCHWHDDVL